MVLLPEVNAREAAVTVERMRSMLAATSVTGFGAVTATIGGVTFLTVPDDVEEMVRLADACMYTAKATGKNRVHLEVARRPDT